MDDARTEPVRDGTDEPAALPRRSRRRHLEPQLREPGGSGDGTPFAAFTAPDADATEDADGAGTRAAAFQRGTRRGPSGS